MTEKIFRITLGERISLPPILDSKERVDDNIIWESMSPKIAKINAHGTLKALKEGFTALMAKKEDGTTIAFRFLIVESNSYEEVTEEVAEDVCEESKVKTDQLPSNPDLYVSENTLNITHKRSQYVYIYNLKRELLKRIEIKKKDEKFTLDKGKYLISFSSGERYKLTI